MFAGFQYWNLEYPGSFHWERNGFEFRAEEYDFFDHPNWGIIDLNPTSPQLEKLLESPIWRVSCSFLRAITWHGSRHET